MAKEDDKKKKKKVKTINQLLLEEEELRKKKLGKLDKKLFWPSKKINLFYESNKKKINFLNIITKIYPRQVVHLI